MNKQLAVMLKDYPQKVRERDSLAHQIAHFRGVTAEDVIDTMYTPKVGGERVQSSTLSDKTAQIALSYREKMDRINKEWYEHLERKLAILNSDLLFFESALDSLPEQLAPVIRDMVIDQLTWDVLASKYHVCRAMIGKYRKRAVSLLSETYNAHLKLEQQYLLS